MSDKLQFVVLSGLFDKLKFVGHFSLPDTSVCRTLQFAGHFGSSELDDRLGSVDRAGWLQVAAHYDDL
jgi:hypothetical protein